MTDTNFQPCLARCLALFHYRGIIRSTLSAIATATADAPSSQLHRPALAPGGGAHVPGIYSMPGASASHPGVPQSFPVQGRRRMTDTNFQPCLARCLALFHYRGIIRSILSAIATATADAPSSQPHRPALAPGGGAHVPGIYSMPGAGAPHPGVPGSFPVPGWWWGRYGKTNRKWFRVIGEFRRPTPEPFGGKAW